MVLGAAGLFAAFPLGYAVDLSALYLPNGLMLRGAAFELRGKSTRLRPVWDGAFLAGSTMAAFSQGVVLGAVVRGIEVSGAAFAGSAWDWLAPFPLLTGGAVVLAYAQLGRTWLLIKTGGALSSGCERQPFLWGLLVVACCHAALLASLWPYLIPPSVTLWQATAPASSLCFSLTGAQPTAGR